MSKKELNKEFKRNESLENFSVWFDWICNELPPGPPIIPMRYYINFHKGGMPFLILFFMIYFQNYSTPCWLYLALHGSYGLIWLMKDYTFPDASFQRKVTIVCFIVPWLVVI